MLDQRQGPQGDCRSMASKVAIRECERAPGSASKRTSLGLPQPRKRGGRPLQAAGRLRMRELSVGALAKRTPPPGSPRHTALPGCLAAYAEPCLEADVPEVRRSTSKVSFRVHLPNYFGEEHEEVPVGSPSPRSPVHVVASTKALRESSSPRSPVGWLRLQLPPASNKKAHPRSSSVETEPSWVLSARSSPQSPKGVAPPWFVPPPSYSSGQGLWW
mmetsp:Transcript_28875/g.66542  ORF Transcript_28875/g.66542 Transcript_28875/m.66542 type:complete len:216 (+) Transcript_28875:80-727(+)